MATIEGGTVIFKSLSIFFEKEKSYRKRNTVRSIRDLRNDGLRIEQIEECSKVKILNPETNDSFCRKITDVSVWGAWVIISW